MNYLKEIETQPANFQRYKKLTPEIWQQTIELAKKAQGKKVIHINSTQLGGGVSELLRSQIPLERSLGVDSRWFIIKAPSRFFKITKEIHNLLQGESGILDESEENFYLKWLDDKIAPSFKKLISQERPDIVIIHDPQPLPLIDYFSERTIPILRLHIDLSAPNPNILKFFQPLIKKYTLVILSHAIYRPAWLPAEKSRIIRPAINPFTTKNHPMKKSEAKRILNLYGIKTDQPIVSQVSRFDPWKDPLGTYQAYRLAKNKIPHLQLILAGLRQAKDDPEAREIFRKVKKQAGGDPDVFLFFNPAKLKGISNDLFINAIYTASAVIIQKSTKEGFGLTVTEAMWKAKAVIGGQTKGLALQIKHGKNGYLVSSPEQLAKYILRLLPNRPLRKTLGRAAHQTVKNKFLLSHLILDHFKIYAQS
ncbi:MAG TPA: glycosyltransferase [Candidatus Portnoybacteria bacterium]|nr:glycosyltransferase [Candidatus Portnoybacteria bacterium]